MRSSLPAVSSLLDEAVAREWMPGCAARVWRSGQMIHASEHGLLATHPDSPLRGRPVGPDSAYDLASLTKVLCTTALVAHAVERGSLAIEALVPAELGVGSYQPRLVDLLEHASGLAAHCEFFHPPWSLGPDQPDALLSAVRAVAPVASPRTRAIYSDLGFLLIGRWLETLHGDSLDRQFVREIAEPLGLAGRIGFRVLGTALSTDDVAPTEVYDPALHAGIAQHWYAIRRQLGQRVAHGIVHDDNAVIMGGVAGHAGLFGTADAVVEIARAWLDERIPGRQRFAVRSSVADSTRRLGFDGPELDGGGSTGGALSSSAFGHLGYTGTSVWIDPDTESIYVLLTNRVHPTRENEAIRELRIRFHRCAVGFG